MLNFIVYCFIIIFCVISKVNADVNDPNLGVISNYYNSINQPNNPQLKLFINQMPKGADLHNHLAGAAYPEWLISYVQADPNAKNWCVKSPDYVANIDDSCQAGGGILINTLQEGSQAYIAVVNAWSMKDFPLSPPNYGHDHFFAAFGKFTKLLGAYVPQLLASLMMQAADENIEYLELMSRSDLGKIDKAAAVITGLPPNPNDITYNQVVSAINQLEANGFTTNVVVTTMIPTATNVLNTAHSLLGCNLSIYIPGCQVAIKIQNPAKRNDTFAQVLAGLYAGAIAHKLQPDIFVGSNLVGAEDEQAALNYYKGHMLLVQYINKYMNNGNTVSLHAGELSSRLPNVKPDDMKNHIANVVYTAGGNRVGHGVDLFTELPNYPNLIKDMYNNGDAIEINLTSNEQILGVCDGESYCYPPVDPTQYNPPSGYNYYHPFYYYIRSNIPTILSTDDQGVEEIDLNAEYLKAVTRYKLNFTQIKKISRDSLIYSFLPGKDMWATKGNYSTLVPDCTSDNPYVSSRPSSTCQNFLNGNEKAQLEWNLEALFARFEIVPILISTCQELQNISANPSGSYILANDIDCSDTKNWNAGAGFEPTYLSGQLNGNHHVISNLYINRPQEAGIGLFRMVSGVVKSLGLINTNLTGSYMVGGIASILQSGIITDSFTTGQITAINSSEVGGLVGYVSGTATLVRRSYSLAQVSGKGEVGGLVGSSRYGETIIDSYAIGSVNDFSTSRWTSGGFFGFNNTPLVIHNCYAAVKVTPDVRGFSAIGTIYGVSGSYWDIQVSGTELSQSSRNATTVDLCWVGF